MMGGIMVRCLAFLNWRVAGLVIGITLLCGAPLTAAAQEPEDNRGDWVSGEIRAMEYDSNSIIVDGRRFQFRDKVQFDGVMLKRDEALERLSPGEFVQIQHGENYSNTIRSIHTRQR
ncbi:MULTISPECIES: hypothetical protein [Halomonadaceae]|uniref:DUF5666 domain-containing protein n=1 Tax=Vreelandella halophila TaxID=86177 RepID=A0A9X4YGT3_9GAMM|nr:MULTISPECIES: hypothetical protein [Halomonas]MYL27755.1 hypothetical protein [Halomonas utahensis]MYL75485.1 hypothetical protein [Halomonas sp. 22501_18_FS]